MMSNGVKCESHRYGHIMHAPAFCLTMSDIFTCCRTIIINYVRHSYSVKERLMKPKNAPRGITGRDLADELTRKRFACAHCGSTWIELIGSIVAREDDRREDLVLRAGMVSETCQMCRLQVRECQKCGSKDIYEVRFAEEASKAMT